MRQPASGGRHPILTLVSRLGVAPLTVLAVFPAFSAAQPVPTPAAVQAQALEPAERANEVEPFDARDLIRKLRDKAQTPAEQAADRDWHNKMFTVAPFIASKPSTGFVAGAAGNVAFYRGEPSTTHISSATGSATFSTRGQILLNAKLNSFTRGDRGLVVGDNRFQWTSEDTYGLGTAAPSANRVTTAFDFVRVYETVYRRVQPALFAGLGLHASVHTNVRAGTDAESAWNTSPYVVYSEAHGLPRDQQASGGASANLLVDTRDNAINPARGWLAHASFRAFFKDFLGGDSAWQELVFDVRTYRHPARARRHTIAVWLYGDLVTGGTAPYFDLPATGMDTLGRSGRGYTEGRFRGERLMYGEVEYRVSLTANGLLGAVAFANVTTVTNLQAGERLFDSFAPGAGGGLRLLLDKRSRTNLCFDLGWGKNGSHGVYLAIQEAF